MIAEIDLSHSTNGYTVNAHRQRRASKRQKVGREYDELTFTSADGNSAVTIRMHTDGLRRIRIALQEEDEAASRWANS